MNESPHRCYICNNPAFDRCMKCGRYVCPHHTRTYRTAASKMGGTWASHIMCSRCSDLSNFRAEAVPIVSDFFYKIITILLTALAFIIIYLIFGPGEIGDKLDGLASVLYTIWEVLAALAAGLWGYMGIMLIPMLGFFGTFLLMLLFTIYEASKTTWRVLVILLVFFCLWAFVMFVIEIP